MFLKLKGNIEPCYRS